MTLSAMTFEDMLRLIEDRSAALRAAAAAVSADSLVPGCPEWTVRDLVAHLGEVQRTWAVIVAAGPSAEPPAEDEVPGARPSGDLARWSADSTRELLTALAAAGPDRPCWTWWAGAGEAPATSGAVARHQVQEAAVHAFDAQEAAGQPEALPQAIAADGIGEYLAVALPAQGPWPHEPGRVVLDTADAGTWAVSLTADGARAAAGDAAIAGARIRGTASDLLLSLYGRIPADVLDLDGDTELAEQFLEWPDNE
jgi:uncharacterized protein (TIGR03083 family)